jgi:hypothetical protein
MPFPYGPSRPHFTIQTTVHCTIQTPHYYRGHPRHCTITRSHKAQHVVEAGQNCCVSNMQWRLRNRGEKMLCQLFVVLCQLLHNRGGYCARGVRNCCVSNQEYRGLHGVKGVHMADGKIPILAILQAHHGNGTMSSMFASLYIAASSKSHWTWQWFPMSQNPCYSFNLSMQNEHSTCLPNHVTPWDESRDLPQPIREQQAHRPSRAGCAIAAGTWTNQRRVTWPGSGKHYNLVVQYQW